MTYSSTHTRRPFVIMYCLMAVLFVAVAWIGAARSMDNQNRIEKQAVLDRRTYDLARGLAQENVDRQVAACLTANSSRFATQQVLDQVAAGTPPTDFSEVRGFSRLDPALQTYLYNLSGATNGASAIKVVADGYRLSNPQQDCKALHAKLDKALKEKLNAGPN